MGKFIPSLDIWGRHLASTALIPVTTGPMCSSKCSMIFWQAYSFNTSANKYASVFTMTVKFESLIHRSRLSMRTSELLNSTLMFRAAGWLDGVASAAEAQSDLGGV